jgi:hypothetical protein
MSLVKLLEHLLIPHESNNQKARLLHAEGLLAISAFLILFQVALGFAQKSFPSVLGYAANISPSEVIRLINQQRIKNGLTPLNDNPTLDAAALSKGNDMLARGYWAHFAPDGTSPWSFFLKFGYKYEYAGENLARDFPDASSAVTAWMNSPSHKENILSPNYIDTGVGVVEGSLNGVDTTIIVQFFGAPLAGMSQIPLAKAQTVSQKPQPSPTPTPTPTPIPAVVSQSESTSVPVEVSPFASTRDVSLGVVGMLLLVLSVDLVVVRRKRIARIGGRTLAHLAYLGMILAVILILKAGQII